MKTKQDQEELGTQSIVEGSICVAGSGGITQKESFAVKNLF
jgi:hypothetical protein